MVGQGMGAMGHGVHRVAHHGLHTHIACAYPCIGHTRPQGTGASARSHVQHACISCTYAYMWGAQCELSHAAQGYPTPALPHTMRQHATPRNATAPPRRATERRNRRRRGRHTRGEMARIVSAWAAGGVSARCRVNFRHSERRPHFPPCHRALTPGPCDRSLSPPIPRDLPTDRQYPEFSPAEGMPPPGRRCLPGRWPVAQLAEHRTVNATVAGSRPAGPADRISA